MHTNIPVLAVTATSTKSTLDCIVQRLGMENVRIVGMSPNRDNIHLSVVQNVTLFEFMQPIVGALKDKGVNYPKTLIFCRSYNDFNLVYNELVCSLGLHLTHPPGYPNAHKYQIVDLYTRGSTEKSKEAVLEKMKMIIFLAKHESNLLIEGVSSKLF